MMYVWGIFSCDIKIRKISCQNTWPFYSNTWLSHVHYMFDMFLVFGSKTEPNRQNMLGLKITKTSCGKPSNLIAWKTLFKACNTMGNQIVCSYTLYCSFNIFFNLKNKHYMLFQDKQITQNKFQHFFNIHMPWCSYCNTLPPSRWMTKRSWPWCKLLKIQYSAQRLCFFRQVPRGLHTSKSSM